tara:strand:+ start:2727 stop:3032 length:306 start_codon:yes stop_codon:yes gene_type:complete
MTINKELLDSVANRTLSIAERFEEIFHEIRDLEEDIESLEDSMDILGIYASSTAKPEVLLFFDFLAEMRYSSVDEIISYDRNEIRKAVEHIKQKGTNNESK